MAAEPSCSGLWTGVEPMTLFASYRPLLPFLALLLLCGLATPCLALDELMDVSRERAKELGITVNLKPRTDDVWVQVEFKPTGPKKEFKYTYLDVTQGGKKLVSSVYLMPFRPTPDSMHFEFCIDPAALPNATVTITVWEDPLTGVGYQLRMKDFMAQAASR